MAIALDGEIGSTQQAEPLKERIGFSRRGQKGKRCPNHAEASPAHLIPRPYENDVASFLEGFAEDRFIYLGVNVNEECALRAVQKPDQFREVIGLVMSRDQIGDLPNHRPAIF